MNNFISVEDQVRKILRDNPSTRSSNDELIVKVYESYGLYLSPQQINALRKAPSFETITRCRRKIQAGGELKASITVQKLRNKQEKAFVDYSKVVYVGNTAIIRG